MADLASAAIRCQSNITERQTYRIVVWQGERRDGKLKYMYEPARSTLVLGLRARAEECGYVVEDGVGFQSWVDDLSSGDVMIWIGVDHQVDFMTAHAPYLAERGVYVISYQTEPRTIQYYQGVAEIWEYSHGNHFDRRSKHFVRVVPPGYVRRFETPTTKPSAETFTWLGLNRCMSNLPAGVRRRVKQTYKVWTVEDWKKVASTNHTVYLTMHKACGDRTRPLESFRLSSILSFGGVLIAEPSNQEDVEMYKGTIIVEPNFYGKKWSDETLALLNDKEALMEWRDSAFELYKTKFDPLAILTRADVWNERSDPPKLEEFPSDPGPPTNQQEGHVLEGQSLVLRCNQRGSTITSFLFVSYGRPSMSASGDFYKGWCHAPETRSRVEVRCLGRESCAIPATNTFFGGDPCFQERKALAANVTCT